jgi:hypothetical protein
VSYLVNGHRRRGIKLGHDFHKVKEVSERLFGSGMNFRIDFFEMIVYLHSP